MSKEGSGRVAVMRATGLVRSYTLECNYNTGRTVNLVGPRSSHSLQSGISNIPPKFTPSIFEDVSFLLILHKKKCFLTIYSYVDQIRCSLFLVLLLQVVCVDHLTVNSIKCQTNYLLKFLNIFKTNFQKLFFFSRKLNLYKVNGNK